MDEGEQDRIDRYPAVLRGLHWARAVLILGMICAGWTMTRMPDEAVAKFGDFYPLHKSFGLLALLVVLVQLAIRARTRLPYPPAALPRPQRGPAVLRSRRPVTPDMDELVFDRPQASAFLPGQYALLVLPGVEGARAYSMADADSGSGRWRFIVRRVPGGAGSAALAALAPGESIEIDGPFGHAHLREGERDIVCIAGGSGLGPMLSVVRGALAAGGPRQVHCFVGLRHQDELGALAEFEGLDPARLTLRTVLSSPAASPHWAGATGFVHTEVERALSAPLDRFEFYFAGPPPMVEAVQALLMLQHRVPPGQIHFDRFC